MNYLSHYYCDYPEDRPYYVLGLILPDLVREVDKKKVRFVPDHLPESTGNDIFDQLNAGVKRHLEVDGLWHNSGYFKEKSAHIKQIFEQHTFSSVKGRIFIFAHVLLELVLDRVVINHDREAMLKLYNSVEMVDKQPLIEYFNHYGLMSRPEGAFECVRYFCKDRFLFRYPDNQMMLYALNVLNQKVGNSVIERKDEEKLVECVEQTEAYLTQEGLDIFDQLRRA